MLVTYLQNNDTVYEEVQGILFRKSASGGLSHKTEVILRHFDGSECSLFTLKGDIPVTLTEMLLSNIRTVNLIPYQKKAL